MRDQRHGIRKTRISVAKVMCLIALTAVIFKWPPLVLAALPTTLFLVYRVLGIASATGAAVLSLLSLLLCLAVCVLWLRSDDLSDGFIWRFRGGWALVRSSRGHIVVGLDSTPGLVVPAGVNRLEYRRSDASFPHVGNLPNILPGILLGPEEDDRVTGGNWGGFAWYENRNPAPGHAPRQWCRPVLVPRGHHDGPATRVGDQAMAIRRPGERHRTPAFREGGSRLNLRRSGPGHREAPGIIDTSGRRPVR